MNEYPTPETDDLLTRNATGDSTPIEDYESLAQLSLSLEQRLAACREALAFYADRNHHALRLGGERARETLKLTTP